MDSERIVVISCEQLEQLFDKMSNTILSHIDNKIKNLDRAEVKQDEILNLQDVERITGYNRGTLYRMTSHRDIPHYKIGGKLKFKRSELEQWMCNEKIPTNREVESMATTFVTINRKQY